LNFGFQALKFKMMIAYSSDQFVNLIDNDNGFGLYLISDEFIHVNLGEEFLAIQIIHVLPDVFHLDQTELLLDVLQLGHVHIATVFI
jgi:hypothetical protein